MITATTPQRQTKYCTQIVQTLKLLGHATNSNLLSALRESSPELSATTVHRATVRLASRGTIAIAPSSKDGSMQYDINTKPHDHFQCLSCGLLKDADIKGKITPILESSIGDCSISGQLTISGTCKKCMGKKRGNMTITIYSTRTCAYCYALKNWLDGKSVKYTEYLVDENPIAAQNMVRLSGQMGVPFSTVEYKDGKQLNILGFDRPKFEFALKADKSH